MKKILSIVATLFALASCGGKDMSGADGTVVPGTQSDLAANVGDKVYFAFDHSGLSEEAKTTLDKQTEWLNKYNELAISIEGHCDERGAADYNLALGERRANSVKNYLVKKGVSAARITVVSYGKEKPEVAGSSEEAWAKNRRGVTVVTK